MTEGAFNGALQAGSIGKSIDGGPIMKKYLVPVLVLVLLLVSVTTVLADRFTHDYNGVGVCTFIQQPGSECETVLQFDGGTFSKSATYCAVGFPIFLKEKGKLSPFLPDSDSIWKCKVEGTYYVDTDGDWGMDYVELEKVTLTEEITTP
jgi:hypothetical protein